MNMGFLDAKNLAWKVGVAVKNPGKGAERLLDRKPSGKSWFMQVGFPGPHPPFVLTEAIYVRNL